MNLLKSIFAVVFSAILVLALYVLTMYNLEEYEPQDKFSQTEWIADESKRYAMTDNLLERKILEGKSKSEVASILGQPDNSTAAKSWDYDVELNHFLLGDRYRLVEVFFEDDTVTNYWYVQVVYPYHELKNDLEERWKKK